MITAVEFVPGYIDREDEILPVPVSSLEELLALPWVKRWEEYQHADFTFQRWVTGPSGNTLFAEMYECTGIFRHCLVSWVEGDPDCTLLASLPVILHLIHPKPAGAA